MLPAISWVLTEDYAGLRAQALGLAEAAGLAPATRVLRPCGIWRHLPAALWPRPLAAIAPDGIAPPLPELVIGCGGKSAAVLAALGRRMRVVIVQHPRLRPERFDLVVAARHDRLTGPNVLVTRTALHRVTPARLAAAAADGRRVWPTCRGRWWRCWWAAATDGSGWTRRWAPPGVAARRLMRADRVGVAVTPSRRTDPAVTGALRAAVEPLGGLVWDMTGDNPYFGLLALADAIVVTGDSVSMLSEAVATRAPVMLARLPGQSRRIGLFTEGLVDDGRMRRPFIGRFEHWPVQPVDDTAAAAAERRRFGY